MWGASWTLGAGSQISAPTGGARPVRPATPHLPAPRHVFGPAKWTASAGGALAVEPTAALTVQLNVDVIGHLRDVRDHPILKKHWLFGAASACGAYRLLGWLVPLLQIDLQLELVGESELRQLLFVCPALRITPWSRISVDVGLRVPVREETREEHRLSMGVNLGLTVDEVF
jgi:hypothetical protein